MLNKFELPNEEIAIDDPRMDVMAKWADFHTLYNNEYERVSDLGLEVERDPRYGNDPSFSYPIQLEARVRDQIPELSLAMVGLRQAFGKIQGWQISWRLRTIGEIIGSDVVQEDGLIVNRAVRAPSEYDSDEGWIVGSHVGGHPYMPGIKVALEIAYQPNQTRGLYYQLDEMQAIELMPPENS